MTIVTMLFIFVLAALLGRELIGRVPSQLHTPLMSGTNAIAGVIIVGALVISRGEGTANMILTIAAITFAMVNVVGGYLVTDRMLSMFKSGKREEDK
ncbi:MAG: NAD(P) transhydrogenase subunit alpha [Trueperaceae bacterium]|nr:NAD(P) transhydrogenase subunit alpha [Trueperaceae bacterium]